MSLEMSFAEMLHMPAIRCWLTRARAAAGLSTMTAASGTGPEDYHQSKQLTSIEDLPKVCFAVQTIAAHQLSILLCWMMCGIPVDGFSLDFDGTS